jgi:PAS domain S-box-containing protein
MRKKILSQWRGWKRFNTIQIIMVGMILLVIGFIYYDISTQRRILEEELLAKGKNMAMTGAQITQSLLESAIQQGQLTEEQVFDDRYIAIPNTVPAKFHTAFDSFTDLNLQDIEDTYLQDADATYAVASDIKGYVPTHNLSFSQPLTGDAAVDLAKNRTKRFFTDSISLKAAQNTAPYLQQIYRRDTGEILWDISAPILVNGKHWGAFRVGFSIQNINHHVQRALERVLIPASFLLIGMIFVTVRISQMHGQLVSSKDSLVQEIELRSSVQALLAKENELLNITLKSMGDSVITLGPDGSVSSCNQSAEALLGRSEAQMIGQPIETVFPLIDPHTNQPIPAILPYLTEENVAEKGLADLAYINQNSKHVLLQNDLFPLKANQETTLGYVLISRDITERVDAVNQSLLSQKMEAIGRLAAGIAHEINTPIQYVGDNINYLRRVFTRYEDVLTHYHQVLQTLQKDPTASTLSPMAMEDALDLWTQKKIAYYQSEAPKAIDESLEGIDRVRKIVLAIREFSHPSQKEKKLVNLNQAITTTITISRNEWKYCADMETDLDPDLPELYCQIDEINQVVLNMIINAAQAIRSVLPESAAQKGLIRITTAARGSEILLTISDTGCGIPDSIRDRIYDPFFTTKALNEGTGQGLAIAHNIIVNNHKGRITVESEVGKGATFIITLPLLDETGQPL